MKSKKREPLQKLSLATRLLLAIAYAHAGMTVGHAQDNTPQTSMATVFVIGGEENLTSLGGAGQILGKKELEDSHVFTVNEALRKVAGVHARDEEGFGLRPNIAMRGLNPTRSTKITLLEDGLPLAYAPYGDNASYYHPMVERSASRSEAGSTRRHRSPQPKIPRATGTHADVLA